MVTALETEDWMIRGAWARNYLLWRNGRTMREARLPLLILPLVFGRLSDIQINVFLTLEVIEAKFRLWRGPDREYAPDAAAEIQAMVSLIGDETGTIVADPFRLHREALHWLERMTH